MSARRYRLTPQFQQDVCAFVRAGGYPHVAAEAAGVPREVFAEWLRKGETGGPRRFRDLADAVRRARAEVRLKAEIDVLKDDPLDWLKFGPGKEGAEAPGWSNPAKALLHRDGPVADWLSHPQMREFMARFLTALTPFPEARAKVAGIFEGDLGKKSKPIQLFTPDEGPGV